MGCAPAYSMAYIDASSWFNMSMLFAWSGADGCPISCYLWSFLKCSIGKSVWVSFQTKEQSGQDAKSYSPDSCDFHTVSLSQHCLQEVELMVAPLAATYDRSRVMDIPDVIFTYEHTIMLYKKPHPDDNTVAIFLTVREPFIERSSFYIWVRKVIVKNVCIQFWFEMYIYIWGKERNCIYTFIASHFFSYR